MCDTMVVLGALTETGRTLFAKNSDREPNEAQYLTQVPAADHAAGAMVRATYVQLPQVAHTHALIGSRPWWMRGMEHGVNEHGLAVGNEAVWSRLPAGREAGLLGMDLVRLTLERAATADEALDVLTTLIEVHGQSGRAAVARDHFYHNAFLLADPVTAWVVESAGTHWVARRVQGWATISNVYSTGTEYDRISDGAEAFAVEQGWHTAGTPFDWAASFTDTERPNYPTCCARLDMSRRGMGAGVAARRVTVADMFTRLRDHGDDLHWCPDGTGQGKVCMHAVSAHEGSETAAAMVADLAPDGQTALWCALGSPCLTAFVPVWFDGGLPDGWSQPAAGAWDAWWAMEHLQRRVEYDYSRCAGAVRATFDAIEARAVEDRSLSHAVVTQQAADRVRQAIAALSADLGAPDVQVPPLRGPYLGDVARTEPVTCLPAGTF